MSSPLQPNKLLLVAYHFPPIQGSTGTTRTLAFSRYLREYGWDVRVLTIRPSAYESTSGENLALVPSWVRVERAWGMDAKRSFSVFGRYPGLLAVPDRWQSWIVGGYMRGVVVFRDWQPDAIMSTYPIPSAHVIGYLLQRKFGVPWIAEFRDPMLQEDYPENALERRFYGWVEKLVFNSASEVIVTTEGCRKLYLDRYDEANGSRITTIPNGYDPEMFSRVALDAGSRSSSALVLLHSGILYPNERDPGPFFRAVQSLGKRGFLEGMQVEFRFRASGNETEYRRDLSRLGIERWIRLEPRLPYLRALEEMSGADALMLFQASNCNHQIPAKTYEYLYCRKPILAFTDPQGDTAELLHRVGVHHIAPLDDSAAIERELEMFLPLLRSGQAPVVSESDSSRFSRKALTGDLGAVLVRALAKPR